ncbi:unnamed protein product, partial [Meganyctiphanes norvegica]
MLNDMSSFVNIDLSEFEHNLKCDPNLLGGYFVSHLRNFISKTKNVRNNNRHINGAIEQSTQFSQYVLYWNKLRNLDLRDYCVVFNTNCEPGAKEPQDTFFLLCDRLPEDRKLRNTLSQMKLSYVVEQKERERSETLVSRQCIYCSKIITGGVAISFHHLTFDHGFSLGNPDNIVFGEKLLDILQDKLQQLKCIFCEKVFKNHVILREHMRKKQHRCLNPKDTQYDRFYLLNYLKPGTPWEEVKQDLDSESDHESCAGREDGNPAEEQLWMDWRGEEVAPTTCLFCHFTTTQVPRALFQHMSQHHNFNFELHTSQLNFYQRVKVVNFIRAHVFNNVCICCANVFTTNHELVCHMRDYNHYKLPSSHIWDRERYHIPVLPNDGFLYHMEDNEVCDLDTSSSSGGLEMIFPEDLPTVSNSILEDAKLRSEIGAGSLDSSVFSAAMCLFCRYTAQGERAHIRVYSHMRAQHCFDFTSVVQGLTFYNQVKLLNYIRFKTAKGECYYCNASFTRVDAMEEHRALSGHIALPDASLFKDRKWLKPVLEEDGLLLRLREAGDSDDDDPAKPDPRGEEVIYSEEIHLPKSILTNDRNLREELLRNVECTTAQLNLNSQQRE